MPHGYEGPEAREWLAATGNPAGFASNRFDLDEARAFVARLYAAGAKRVFIPRESIRDDAIEMAQGGPYADALVAEFDPDDRVEILRIFQREAEHEGHDGEVSGEDGWLFFWWD